MIWLIILYLPVLGVSVFFFLRAMYRFFNTKEYFWSILPDCEKDCINDYLNCGPRRPIPDYYKKHPPVWNREYVESLLERNEILLKYDKEKAEQLFLAEKQIFYSGSTAVGATAIFAFLCVMMK